MHLICNCQSGTVEESAETWMLATSGSAGPRRADKLSKIFFLRSRSRRCSGNSLEHCGGEEYSWSVDLHLLRIHLWGLNLFPRGKEGGCGGWQLGQLVTRDWSRFILHLLLSWRVCKRVIFSVVASGKGCAMFSLLRRKKCVLLLENCLYTNIRKEYY